MTLDEMKKLAASAAERHVNDTETALAAAVLKLAAVVEALPTCEADRCLGMRFPRCFNVATRSTQDECVVCDIHKGPNGYTADLPYASQLRALASGPAGEGAK